MHLAVGLGVAVGTAVLAGALVVGDSVRSSLKRLTLERLGQIDLALVSDRPFRAELAQELASHPDFPPAFQEVQPALLLRGSVDWLESGPQTGQAPHAAGVTFVGAAPDFFNLGEWSAPRPGRGEVILNQTLAEALAAELIEFQITLGTAQFSLRSPPGMPPWTASQAGRVLLEPQRRPRIVRVGQAAISLTAADLGLDRPAAGAAHHDAQSMPAVQLSLAPGGWQLDIGGLAARLYVLADHYELSTAQHAHRFQLGETVTSRLSGLSLTVSARRPQVAVGDDLVLRLPRPSDIPPDSPLGRKSGNIASRRLRVAGIVPDAGLGRFSLNPSQQAPRNLYVPLEELQSLLRRPGSPAARLANCLLVAGKRADTAADPRAEEALARALRPRLADYGLTLAKTRRGYMQLTSQQMILEPHFEEAALRALAPWKPQPALTYLANYILAGPDQKGRIPYSTVAALDPVTTPPLGPLLDVSGRPITSLKDDELLLNRWAADDLAAQGVRVEPGTPITLTYFEPESTHGEVRERTARFRLAGIVELKGAAADPDLTPELRGVTDEASIRDWDPPFPYDPDRVRSIPPNDQDERYWEAHRATPKAFVSLRAGRRLWESRFGRATAVRCARPVSLPRAAEALERSIDPRRAGFVFQPLKRQGLAASAGTTSFGLLFLGFSMFLIVAAMLLVNLLFRLGVERRVRELGLLLAVGWTRQRAVLLLVLEGALGALTGSALGALAGLGYAWLMLAGLRTWWLAAIREPFLQLDASPTSLLLGGSAGALAALVAILWAVRSGRALSVRQLMAGQVATSQPQPKRSARTMRGMAVTALAGAILLALLGRNLTVEAQAGAFMGAGALVLASLLTWLWAIIRAAPGDRVLFSGPCQLVRLALRNARRHPARTLLTLGLMASACFLIVALAAFRLDAEALGHGRSSGTGGYALMAQSTVPIYRDLNALQDRESEGLSPADRRMLRGARFFSFRVQAGDDASCLNLYRPQQPRVLGASREFLQRGGFRWRATAAQSDAQRQNPWLLLDTPTPPQEGESWIPAVLDQNTATYSLHLSGVGSQFEMPDGRGGSLRFVVVGLLQDSILQGDVIISEAAFRRAFPQVSGARLFLIDVPEERAAAVAGVLERALADEGLEVQPAAERLAGFLAVQNTYLSTFQSLSGLGLLLGTLGLAAVQLRSVVERRGELALLRATGFSTSLVARLVFWEHAALLLGGLGCGLIAAWIAVLPQLVAGGAGLPWFNLAAMLGLVLAVGLAAGLASVLAVVRAPLIEALREEA
jgi:ABC-type antimicrobial peptide transport system permease subunit